MKLRKTVSVFVVVGACALLLLVGCASTPRAMSGVNTEAQIEAAQRVLDRIRDYLGDTYPQGAAQFEMGDLDDGCAVLLVEVNGAPSGAAFWTRGPAVYVVNDAARAMSKTLPDAPETITLNRVRAVVR